jgi:hypothetical protein
MESTPKKHLISTEPVYPLLIGSQLTVSLLPLTILEAGLHVVAIPATVMFTCWVLEQPGWQLSVDAESTPKEQVRVNEPE